MVYMRSHRIRLRGGPVRMPGGWIVSLSSSNGESRVAQRRRMEDAGVGLERLLGREVARNRGVSAQRHCDGERGWAE